MNQIAQIIFMIFFILCCFEIWSVDDKFLCFWIISSRCSNSLCIATMRNLRYSQTSDYLKIEFTKNVQIRLFLLYILRKTKFRLILDHSRQLHSICCDVRCLEQVDKWGVVEKHKCDYEKNKMIPNVIAYP